MTKLVLQVDKILKEVYALGETHKEYGSELDQVRVDELRNDIFTLFKNEFEEIMVNHFKRENE